MTASLLGQSPSPGHPALFSMWEGGEGAIPSLRIIVLLSTGDTELGIPEKCCPPWTHRPWHAILECASRRPDVRAGHKCKWTASPGVMRVEPSGSSSPTACCGLTKLPGAPKGRASAQSKWPRSASSFEITHTLPVAEAGFSL